MNCFMELLPSGIFGSIICEWLDDVQSLIDFDNAITNKAVRVSYLQMLKLLGYEKMSLALCVNSESQMEKCCNWMISRHISSLDLSLTSMSFKVERMLLDCFGGRLRSLKINAENHNTYFDVSILTKDNFPVLNSLSLEGVILTNTLRNDSDGKPEDDNLYANIVPLKSLKITSSTVESPAEVLKLKGKFELSTVERPEEATNPPDDVEEHGQSDDDKEEEEDDGHTSDDDEAKIFQQYFDICHHIFEHIVVNCARIAELTIHSCEYFASSTAFALVRFLFYLETVDIQLFTAYNDIDDRKLNSILQDSCSYPQQHKLSTVKLAMQDKEDDCSYLIPILLACRHCIDDLTLSTNCIQSWVMPHLLQWIEIYGCSLTSLTLLIGDDNLSDYSERTTDQIMSILEAFNTNCIQLEYLTFTDSPNEEYLHNFRFEVFNKLRSLSFLNVSDVDDNILRAIGLIKESFPYLQEIAIERCDKVTVDGVLSLLDAYPELTSLTLSLVDENFPSAEEDGDEQEMTEMTAEKDGEFDQLELDELVKPYKITVVVQFLSKLFEHPTVKQLKEFAIDIEDHLCIDSAFICEIKKNWLFDFHNLRLFSFEIKVEDRLDLPMMILDRIFRSCPKLYRLKYDFEHGDHTSTMFENGKIQRLPEEDTR